MALKVANGMKNWVEWERPCRLRDKAALAAFAAENEEEIGFWKFDSTSSAPSGRP